MNDLSQQATVTLSQTPELSNNDLMANENGETMPFGMLLQFMCHKISQELIVISELLPKYTDYNRKITITEFTYMARCLASKILAIVRWLKNYSKHDMCKRIQSFLDSQSQMFRDTADALCTIARNELVFARVPMYEVSTSVALSYGENIKIPIAIKKRFVPEEKISKAERNNILSIINGNIKSRLSLISSLIPPNIQNIRVKNGIVTLVVPGEFELSLTLLNNDANTKWTLLDIKVLVEQYEIGYGTKLVHPMQLYQIHQYLQQMIVHSKNPINDLYKYMHDFSTSLQLDVLFCESSQLASNQLRNKIIIEKYSQETGELVISYWLILKDKKQYVPSQYKIRICKDKNKPNNKLLVRHYPYIRGAPTLNFNTGRLSMSKLLCEISSMRIVEKLKELKTKLLKIKPLCECIFHDDLHPYISFNLLPSNNMNEDSIMNIYVNTFTGNVTCQMYEDDKNVQVFNDKINRNCNNIDELSVIIRDIKISILMKRYRKIVEKYNLFECSNLVVEEAQSIIHSNHCIVTMLGKKNNESLIFSIKTLDDNNLKINFYICKIANDMCLVRKYNPSNDIMNKRPETIDDILIGMTKNEINKNSINEEKTTDSNLITNFQYLESTFNAFINEYMICKVFSRFCNLPDGNAHFNGKRSTGIGAFTNLFTKNSKAEVYKFGKMALSIVDLWTNDIGPYNIYAVTFDIYNTPVKVDFYKRDRNDNHVVLLNGTNKTFVNFKCYKPWIHPFKIFENISESMRLKRHFNFVIYKAMKNFSHYYYKYFKSFCNIKAYTNGSVTIAYGENRNYLLFLSTCKKNIPYALRFGIDSTKSFVNGDNYKGGEEFIKALNPHMYFIHHLEKYFKNEFFMIFLMKYILKTLNSFLIIFNMPVPRCFLGIYSYEFTSMNNKMEIIAPSKISIYDEFTIRLLLGNSTLEIFVGDEDCIYITDGSCQDKKIPGLHSLILTYSYHKKSFNKPFFDYTNEELESFFEIKNMRYKINYSTLRKLCYDIDGENKYPVLPRSHLILRSLAIMILIPMTFMEQLSEVSYL
uniref:Mediator of RNA polymerase II transcription subunit 14 n=1 Tax=Parastrongyloides trichosuri TaxID=131310 RepID=A0A0N4ZLU8_PARTI